MNKHLLHIANDFSGSIVYKNLSETLAKSSIKQTIFTAIRDPKLINKNRPEDTAQINVKYRVILKWWMRLLFKKKISCIFKDLKKEIDLSDIDLIHAHTWYSDGAVALYCKKKINIPYVVSIRNTDINIFYPFMFHLRHLGKEILHHADKIIFISAAHQKRILTIFQETQLGKEIEKKSVLIPNGIENYWFENIHTKKNKIASPFKLIYVGKFDTGKNVPRLMKAIIKLNKDSKNNKFFLSLVGEGGHDTAKIQSIINKYPDYFSYLGHLKKEELCIIYRNHDAFAMPSLAETFGLVYIEAMTQGLPVLYSEGEGIDGFFSPAYGVKCLPKSVDSIKKGIETLKSNYSEFIIDPIYLKKNFNWEEIAAIYLSKIYQEI